MQTGPISIPFDEFATSHWRKNNMWYKPIVFISLTLFTSICSVSGFSNTVVLGSPITSKKAREIQPCGELYHSCSRQMTSHTEQVVGDRNTLWHRHFYFYIFDGHRCSWGWASVDFTVSKKAAFKWLMCFTCMSYSLCCWFSPLIVMGLSLSRAIMKLTRENLAEWMDPWLLAPWFPTFMFMPQQIH